MACAVPNFRLLRASNAGAMLRSGPWCPELTQICACAV
ncbi:hypothetical protein PC116_g12339 [Phytophthora cactorum]|uniref:Uncharacterized protein n=1 Tax=Phytophthora cactorum TaxID=29920 RepID=A0A8T1EJN9_9STRA|nr:hypothetical protein PC114_g2677 [Phytophthora cactorum]KAG2951835.1 hypothetical protein PC117_g3247 [Phytophthora cactorum]KAG3022513.1 hypothetical protein PC120_g8081 [Phytophthora cactorum]KAG3161728.1 hypothetical protein C6341_g13494 [Phytophthora cactorum]KAG3195572.1 hypothetical protein PC128_g8369 [Phytophthora cactorum]